MPKKQQFPSETEVALLSFGNWFNCGQLQRKRQYLANLANVFNEIGSRLIFRCSPTPPLVTIVGPEAIPKRV
jgi:hypothetical protein